MGDRVGLGWRPELAVAIHCHLDRIEVLEFLAEDWLTTTPANLHTLNAWCRLLPVHLHGTTLGLSSVLPVSEARLKNWARLIEQVQPVTWSEHLAFVRSPTIELGHLAAPPRQAATLMATQHNLLRAHAVIGSLPLLENVASLLDAPGSECDETAWLGHLVVSTEADLLLDLHNFHANAVNGGWDAIAALARLPLHRVRAIHLAGGKWWRGRIVDDHRHAVPDAVFALLEEVAARIANPLDVIIERDGAYPPFAELLAELDTARAALARGRARRMPWNWHPPSTLGEPRPDAQAAEALLIRLYSDANERARFLADPLATAHAAGLDAATAAALATLDREGLILAADSLTAKLRQPGAS